MLKDLFQEKKFIRLLAALVVVLPFEFLSFADLHLPLILETGAFLIIAVIFGKKIFKEGFKSLLSLRFSDINLLMTIAVIGAWYLGELEEAAIIVILFSLAETMEDFGIEKSRFALDRLVSSIPRTAELKSGEKVTVEQVAVGAIIVIRNGDTIPCDGEVALGSSFVEEAAVTGEPFPKTKIAGDRVFAGSTAAQGYLEIRVTKDAKDSTLQKIVDLTFSATERKSKSQRFIEKFSQIYIPIILISAIGTLLVPTIVMGQPFAYWFAQAITLLIIACPCALVISTPVSIFSTVGNFSRKGIVVKGGLALEELGNARAIAFDKTGTLTKGIPVVADVVTFGGVSENALVGCIGGLELRSEHPLSRAVSEYASKKHYDLHASEGFKALPGKGVEGTCLVCAESHRCAGTLKYISEEHGSVPSEVLEKARKFEAEGKTVILLSNGLAVEGIIAFSDTIKEDAEQTIRSISSLGLTPVMLTGDASAAALFVGGLVGIKEVHASLLPEDKVTKIDELMKKYGGVVMVGDGVNDAPALARASVGVAMGAAGSDVAIENADIAIMNDRIALLPDIIASARKMVRIIRFNTALAVGVKFIFLGLAIVGQSTIIGAIVADVGVSVFVILNSLRLWGSKSDFVASRLSWKKHSNGESND